MLHIILNYVASNSLVSDEHAFCTTSNSFRFFFFILCWTFHENADNFLYASHESNSQLTWHCIFWRCTSLHVQMFALFWQFSAVAVGVLDVILFVLVWWKMNFRIFLDNSTRGPRNNDFSINIHASRAACAGKMQLLFICMSYLYANASILWMNYDYLFKFGTFSVHETFSLSLSLSFIFLLFWSAPLARFASPTVCTTFTCNANAKLHPNIFDIPKIASHIQNVSELK